MEQKITIKTFINSNTAFQIYRYANKDDEKRAQIHNKCQKLTITILLSKNLSKTTGITVR